MVNSIVRKPLSGIYARRFSALSHSEAWRLCLELASIIDAHDQTAFNEARKNNQLLLIIQFASPDLYASIERQFSPSFSVNTASTPRTNGIRRSCSYGALPGRSSCCSLAYDVEIRKVICTTNATESINARHRRAVRARRHFPNEAAAIKCLYLVTRSLDPTGGGRARSMIRWKPALNAFAVTLAGRVRENHLLKTAGPHTPIIGQTPSCPVGRWSHLHRFLGQSRATRPRKPFPYEVTV